MLAVTPARTSDHANAVLMLDIADVTVNITTLKARSRSATDQEESGVG
jgi:hypothetical protein